MTVVLYMTLKFDVGVIFELLVNFIVLSNYIITMITIKMKNSCVHILFSCLISNFVFVLFIDIILVVCVAFLCFVFLLSYYFIRK